MTAFATRTLPDHGTTNADRKKLDSRYHKLRVHALHNGTWRHPVDAAPSVSLVREYLAAGWTERQIEHAAGLHKNYIGRLLGVDTVVPAPVTLLPGTADAIAAVASADRYGVRIPDATLVSTVGSLRRVQSLAAGAWSYSALAARGVRGVRHLPEYAVTSARRARTIRDLSQELWDVPGPSPEAAEKALLRGFAPAMAWYGLDIDGPRAVPDFGAPADPVLALVENADYIRETDRASWLHVAERLAVDVDTLHTYRTRVRERAAATAAPDPI